MPLFELGRTKMHSRALIGPCTQAGLCEALGGRGCALLEAEAI